MTKWRLCSFAYGTLQIWILLLLLLLLLTITSPKHTASTSEMSKFHCYKTDLQRFAKLLDDFVSIVELWLTDEHIILGDLGKPARAIFFVRQDGTAASDAWRWHRLVSQAANHLLLVKQTCWNMVDLCWSDEVRPVNKRFTTSKEKKSKINLYYAAAYSSHCGNSEKMRFVSLSFVSQQCPCCDTATARSCLWTTGLSLRLCQLAPIVVNWH